MSMFKARRVSRTYVQRNTAPPEEVFPLLDPVREREWAHGWECTMVYSESGLGEEGCVFLTRHPDESETVWTMTERDFERLRVGFALVTPGFRVGRIEIALDPNADGTTAAAITYTFTGLSEQGNDWIDAYTEAAFVERMKRWEAEINHYLEHGRTKAG
jgi:hypothetical protein